MNKESALVSSGNMFVMMLVNETCWWGTQVPGGCCVAARTPFNEIVFRKRSMIILLDSTAAKEQQRQRAENNSGVALAAVVASHRGLSRQAEVDPFYERRILQRRSDALLVVELFVYRRLG